MQSQEPSVSGFLRQPFVLTGRCVCPVSHPVSGALDYSASEPGHLYMDCVVRPGAPADCAATTFHMFTGKQPPGLAGAPQDAVPFAHSTQRSGVLSEHFCLWTVSGGFAEDVRLRAERFLGVSSLEIADTVR